MSVQCRDCAFWYSTGQIGQCRKHAPVKMDVNGVPTTTWPDTAEHDWCGDYTCKTPPTPWQQPMPTVRSP